MILHYERVMLCILYYEACLRKFLTSALLSGKVTATLRQLPYIIVAKVILRTMGRTSNAGYREARAAHHFNMECRATNSVGGVLQGNEVGGFSISDM